MRFSSTGRASSATLLLSLCATIIVMSVRAWPASTRPGSSASDSLPQNSVELLVVVDKPAYRQWLGYLDNSVPEEDRHELTVQNITDYVRATVAGANLIWKGMEEHGIRLDLRIADLRIVTSDDILTPGPDGESVQNEPAFWDFFHWLVRNGLEYDHALLFTGLNLMSEHTVDPEGYAYMDTMCGTQSISLIESMPNGVATVVVAHEIAHSFGARHDGEGNNDCNGTSGHIMNSDKIGTSPKHWTFSNCSAAIIRATLEELRAHYDCLSADSTWADPLDVPYLGQLYTADEMCQLRHGDHSYLCRHLYSSVTTDDPSDLCQVSWCLINATYCTGDPPVDGVPCGRGKRCLAGRCVPFDDVPEEVNDHCYAGDMPHPVWKNQTCQEVIDSYTHMCLDQWYLDFCCRTCDEARTGSEDCPYGDAHSRCAWYYCGTEWEEECCVTCPRR